MHELQLADGASAETMPPVDALALQLSEVAYLHEFAAVPAVQSAGFTVVDRFDKRGTQVLLCLQGRTAFVAFRGTSEDLDIGYDLLFVPCPWRPSQHVGFALAWGAVRSEVKTWLTDFRSDYDQVIFTGHSLGAAIAAIAAKELVATVPVARVVTFGMPRTFWLMGVFSYNRTKAATSTPSLGEITIRYVNGDDIIPRIVPWALGYKHVGVKRPVGADPWAWINVALKVLETITSPGSTNDAFDAEWRNIMRLIIGGVLLASASAMPMLIPAVIVLLLVLALANSGGSHGSRRYLSSTGVAPLPRPFRDAKDARLLFTKVTLGGIVLALGWWVWTSVGWVTLWGGAVTHAVAIALAVISTILLLRIDVVDSPQALFGFGPKEGPANRTWVDEAPGWRKLSTVDSEPDSARHIAPLEIEPPVGGMPDSITPPTEILEGFAALREVTSTPVDPVPWPLLSSPWINPITGKPYGYLAAMLLPDPAADSRSNVRKKNERCRGRRRR